MKKSKLMKLLADIPDNADIRLWNGMVGDWMDIESIKPTMLFMVSLDHELKVTRMRNARDVGDPAAVLSAEQIADIKKEHRTLGWEYNQWVTQTMIDDGYYNTKTVFIIDAKTRGVHAFDRLGSIDY